jgi:hypothetical protein
MEPPKFSDYPWRSVAKRTRREAAIESVLARWVGMRRSAPLLRGLVRVSGVRVGQVRVEPLGACCELSMAGEVLEVHGAGALVRDLAQRWLGGPQELDAPRPLGVVEHALWAHAVAAATRELAIQGAVRPRLVAEAPLDGRDLCPAGSTAEWRCGYIEGLAIELMVELEHRASSVIVIAPRDVQLRVPPRRGLPAWAEHMGVDAPIVVARCTLSLDQLARLAVRDLVTVEPCCELEIFGGAVALTVRNNDVVAEVRSEYICRPMALADDAQVEVAVTLGTTRLSLRDTLDLAVGQIVSLGRPLAGPFDVRAAGRLIGRGELVDVEGELAVRIVSLEEK